MRILLVTHYYADHRGGVEIVAAELASRLAARGVEIVWAASGPAPACLPFGVRALPMRAWNVSEERLGVPYPLWGPGSVRRLCRAVRECDLVHLHDCLYLGNVVAHLAARRARKPVVVTQHIGMIPYRSRLLRLLLETANRVLGKVVLGGCDRAVFISERVLDYFRARVHFTRAAWYVPNGVDTACFFPLDDAARHRLRRRLGWSGNQKVMLFVGRFVEKKGLPILWRLAAEFPDCRWVFAGWGPDDPARWGLTNVQCLGAVPHDQTADYYRAADLLVLPSVGEGFPLVVQEAMACGTPVLVSSETAQATRDLADVAYVSDLDFPALVSLVSSILDSPDKLTYRRLQAAQFAHQRWDWETCADKYARLFAELVGGQLPRHESWDAESCDRSSVGTGQGVARADVVMPQITAIPAEPVASASGASPDG